MSVKILKYTLFILLFFGPINVINAATSNTDSEFYTILLRDEVEYGDFQKILQESNIEIVYSIQEVGMLQVKASENSMKKLGVSSFVKTYGKSIRTVKSSFDYQSSIDENKTNTQWDMDKVTNNGESYKIFPGTKNVGVAIIDSGLDIEHPDLKNNVLDGSKNFVPVGGFRGEELNENGERDRIDDLLGHGTEVAGQVAANGLIKGVAPGVGIKAYRVFGEREAETIWIIKAIVEAAKDNSDVINLSLGDYLLEGEYILNGKKIASDLPEIEGYKRAIKFASRLGSVVVAAAGNEGLNVRNQNQMNDFFKKHLEIYDLGDISFKGVVRDIPADLPGVVSVSSIGNDNTLSVFTNYGNRFTDIVAPGGDNKLLNQYGGEVWYKNKMYEREHVLTTAPNGEYVYQFGNSVAAPKVSGALALIIDKQNLKNRPNESIRYLYKYGVDKEGNHFGNGILNVYKIVSS
ncbi:S8 family serine peptidase [Bacillus sp. GM_Baccil_2]|uniref:S8 family peptidase n=1 Tax=Bacillus sp. GM_Baccil_2 TaxID=2937369 RepID=UPI00226ACA3A